jgi:hypothetical protein
MLQYLRMDRQVRARHIRCKVLSIVYLMMSAVLFQGLYRISSDIYKDVKMKK